MSHKEKGLRKYMTARQRDMLGNLPTSHENCLKLFKVARPGKTARDRAKNAAARIQ